MNGNAARTGPHAARRALVLPIAMLVFVVLLIAPASQSEAQEEGDDSVSEGLSGAIEDYLNAQDELNALEQEQEDLVAELSDSEAEIEELNAELAEYVARAYASSDLQSTSALLASEDPGAMIDALGTLQFLGQSRAERLNDLVDRLAEIEATQQTLDDNIAEQEQATEDMEAARDEAAHELAASGGDSAAGPTSSDARAADPAPRNPDGSLPYESCSEDDPSPADGCVTPRTLHSLEQAQFAGFTRYVNCYRPTGSGEHPKGRACDYSSESGGFGGAAGGEDYDYGQNLAAWFTENADALGVQYVIWYRQIWFPGSGWKSYGGAYGDPSSDHTNHVHVSIR